MDLQEVVWGGAWTGLIWLRIRVGRGNKLSDSIKCGEGGNFLTSCQDLSVSQEGLCSLELVRQLVSSLVRVDYQFRCRGLVFGDLGISVGQLLNAQPVEPIQDIR